MSDLGENDREVGVHRGPSDGDAPSGNHRDPGIVDALPGLARLAAGAWLRSAAWGVETSWRVGSRVARVAVSPNQAGELVEELRNYARELLGVADLDRRVRQLTSPGASGRRANDRGAPLALREAGAQLLVRSADVTVDDETHPAFARILAELHPDEARILRLLRADGPQPSVDVRTGNLIGFGGQLVAQGLNMIGAEAGLRHVDRVPAYLNNLNRLGLIWFSHDPIDDPMRYQVLEAQPETMAAIKRAGRARTVHRGVALTAFGTDFCDVVLPLDPTEVEKLAPEV
jgi:hypothetical protein